MLPLNPPAQGQEYSSYEATSVVQVAWIRKVVVGIEKVKRIWGDTFWQ